jgi:hypothetical protein
MMTGKEACGGNAVPEDLQHRRGCEACVSIDFMLQVHLGRVQCLQDDGKPKLLGEEAS